MIQFSYSWHDSYDPNQIPTKVAVVVNVLFACLMANGYKGTEHKNIGTKKLM